MKKIASILITFIIFFLIYLMQANFFNWFNIAGVKPNLFIIFVLFLGLFAGKKVGMALGIIFGLILDFLIGQKIGITGIMLGAIGLLGGYFDKNFSKDSRITLMIMVIGSTLLFELAMYIINSLLLSYQIEIASFLKIVIIEITFNTLLTIILYPILQKLGYRIEDVFKDSKILTRYF